MVAAAGGGERLRAGGPKALCRLAGEPLIVHAVRRLVAAGVDSVVVAAPTTTVVDVARMLRPVTGDLPFVVVAGRSTRRQSVAASLRELPDDAGLVLVHDAARPLVPVELVTRVLDALRAGADAVVPVVPVDDTVKEVADGRVVRTVDRLSLRAVQTPQGFARSVLERAHCEWRGAEPTDDAAMVEALGVPVTVVDGAPEAFKITRPLDLRLAEAVLAARTDD